MASKRLVVGNMKMNLTALEINDYLEVINNQNYDNQIVLCPSSLYLPYFIGNHYATGIQNIAAYENGAYTGEISAKQAKSMYVDYAIIGHSERRGYFHETDEIIHQKIILALEENLKVILCIGETEEERDFLKTYKVLKKQIISSLTDISIEKMENIILAYEPIWAIGTNKIPSNAEIEETISFIKKVVKNTFGVDISVLYGGSVNEKNITLLEQIENINGYLIGGASTKIDKFIKIIEVVVNQ